MPLTIAVCDYASALDFLLHRINYERTTQIPYRSAQFKLDRMRRLLELLGNPHLGLKAVHIAGTKGKGSTAAMTAAVLQAAGYRTGLYTSPHLARIEERLVIDGRVCPPATFAALAAELQPAVEQIERELPFGEITSGPTFFEVTTAMAFLHFARAKVDLAVLEVGLGGRLDSTNVCQPEVCVITSISFDHVKQLGHTLAAIAGEKAGIIKPGVPVISGVLADEPREVIASRAQAIGAPLVQCGVDYAAHHAPGTTHLDYWEPASQPQYRLDGVRLAMLGEHQAANAATAIAAINRLRERGWAVSDAATRHGLAAARCPARIELIGQRPALIVDVAHNLASVKALLAVLDQEFAARRRILIFASSMDKDYAGMLRLLVPRFDGVIVTRYVNNPRAMDVQELRRLAASLTSAPVESAPDPAAALALARRWSGPNDLICITGSFFLAAELRPLVLEGGVAAGTER